MARYEHFNEVKHQSAKGLANHLRTELGLKDYTLEKAKELTKVGMLDALVEEYKRAGLPLLGAPGYPWPLTPGQTPADKPAPAAQKMTAKEASAKMAKARLNQLLDKDIREADLPHDPETGKLLIDPMHMTGPGYIHPRFWELPALPRGQEYRVAVIFDPQGKESSQQTHVALNGRALIAQRDQIVFLPAEYISGVVENARGMIDAGPKANQELNIDQNGKDLKLRPFRTEYMREVGEAITDSKGALIRWIRRTDGQPIPEPVPYGAAAPMEPNQARL